jgi:hypothetical protein
MNGSKAAPIRLNFAAMRVAGTAITRGGGPVEYGANAGMRALLSRERLPPDQ